MKKLAIIVAVAFAAICSQAASVNWQFTAGGTAEKGAHVYMIAGNSAPTAIENWSEWIADQTVVSDKALSWNNMTKKATANVTAQSDSITKGNSYFFVMLDAEGKNFKTTSTFNGSDIVYDTAAQESQITTSLNSAFGDWTEIKAITPDTPTGDAPEPTSGLLLLVGAAAMALRRRRA